MEKVKSNFIALVIAAIITVSIAIGLSAIGNTIDPHRNSSQGSTITTVQTSAKK